MRRSRHFWWLEGKSGWYDKAFISAMFSLSIFSYMMYSYLLSTVLYSVYIFSKCSEHPNQLVVTNRLLINVQCCSKIKSYVIKLSHSNHNDFNYYLSAILQIIDWLIRQFNIVTKGIKLSLPNNLRKYVLRHHLVWSFKVLSM